MVINDLLSWSGFLMYETEGVTAVHYAEAWAGYGAVKLSAILKDQETIQKLSNRYDKVVDQTIPIKANHVNANVYGILPLELFMNTGDQ